MARVIKIVEYQSRWPAQFAAIADRLNPALGDDALRIDHIGSTSVPGLAAKDIVDVQVTIGGFDDTRHRPALEAIGLEWSTKISRDHLPPGADLPLEQLSKRFATGTLGTRTNVHLRIAGRFNQRYPLLCRDYLRAHPAAAAAYAEVKRSLARLFPDDEASYYAVKDPVFDLIMAGAEDWAFLTDWAPASS